MDYDHLTDFKSQRDEVELAILLAFRIVVCYVTRVRMQEDILSLKKCNKNTLNVREVVKLFRLLDCLE